MKKNIAVILSGCGVYDGSEIHESVLTLLALDKAGLAYRCFAPDVEQHHVINHCSGEEMPESRNVLVESARIARGEIQDITSAKVEDFDALIFPGGFGAAKNLCKFAFVGPNAEVQPRVKKLVKDFFAAKKPIGLICIAPALGALILGKQKVQLTIGTDSETAAGVNATGAIHHNCPVDDIYIDEENRIISTPAYMLGKSISEVAIGIDKLVKALVRLL
jgi:enhancing lycopene biosynthesis protein 2